MAAAHILETAGALALLFLAFCFGVGWARAHSVVTAADVEKFKANFTAMQERAMNAEGERDEWKGRYMQGRWGRNVKPQ